MKKLTKEELVTRRAFLRRSVLGRLIPAVGVFLIARSTPPLFGQSAGGGGTGGGGRPEPI